MPTLQFDVPEPVAERLRSQAEARGVSLPDYLAEIVQRATRSGWPEGYFEEVVGGWQGEPLERPEPLESEEREPL